MNNRAALDAQLEANLRAIWKGSSVVPISWTPEQIETRARQFEARAKRQAMGDLLAFVLLPLLVIGVGLSVDMRALLHESWGRILIAGAVLLCLCSLVGLLALKRHSYAAVPGNAGDLLASHLERLARLRDWYASTPWGVAMYIPGAILVMIGSALNPKGKGWEMPIIWAGIAAFVFIVACVQTRLKAQSLQREIDSLKRLR
jgi:hypothetical protein